MSRYHELDRPFIFGHEPDTSMGVGETSHGDSAGRIIKAWFAERGEELSFDATYLGLGIGQAYQEVAFAQQLQITPDRATMVDRSIAGYTRDRLASEFPGVGLIESGIFAFLENPTRKGFSLVSAFGIEYIFERKGASEAFVDAMQDVVGDKGIVFISFYCGPNVDSRWENAGFDVVKGYARHWSQLMYVKKG